MKKIIVILIICCTWQSNAQELICGTPDPTLQETQQMIREIQKSKLETKISILPTGPIVIPVQAHIIRNTDGTGGLNPTVVLDEILLAMDKYTAHNISFQILPINYIDDSSLLVLGSIDENGVPEGDTMSSANNNPNKLNMYFVNYIYYGIPPDIFLVGGYAYYPNINSPDYLVVASSNVNGTGSTLAHETGHYFGLFHTFGWNTGEIELVNGTNCEVAGDFLCDTPADGYLFFGDINRFTCSYSSGTDPNGDPYMADGTQMMSYNAPFGCRINFSPDAENRIRFYMGNDDPNTRSYLFTPTAVCDNFTAELDSGGNVTITGADVDGGSTDPNDNLETISVSPSSFTCTNIGANTVTLTVTDSNGFSDTCTATVTVEDNFNPIVVGQNATGDLIGAGSVTIPISSVDNGSTDNCSIDTLTLTPDTFTAIGTYSAILEGTDPSGNSDSVTVSITIIDSVDSEDPIAVCQNITLQLDGSGSAMITGINIDGGSSDNIGIVSYTAVPDTFNCNDIGTNNVTLNVADAEGNTDSCIAIVTVEDNFNPIVVGQNATGNLNGSGSITIPISSVDNGSIDNCNIDTLTLTPDTFTAIGTYSAVLEGTDLSGNSDSVTVSITIIDTADSEDPIAICQNITVQLDNNGSVMISGVDIDGGSSDNIGIVSYTAVPDSFNCNDIGANSITLTVADAAGNTGSCVSTITVEDNLNPIVLGQNVTGDLNGTNSVTISIFDVNNGSNDNCNIVTLTLTPDTFTAIGTYSAILEGTDPSDNSDNVTVIITIIDSILNNIDQEFTSFTLYPNPANTKININVGENNLLKKIEVYDIAGKLIIDKLIEQPTQTISVDITELTSSIYFVAITDEYNKRVIKKLVKE